MQDAITERLRSVDQRYTANRRAIVDALAKAEHPLTIPGILKRNKRLATSSVYRNLVVLEEAQVVHRIVTHDEFARYELAEDLTNHHHHHLICMSCGRVEDFTAAPALEEAATVALTRAAGKAGFTVRSHRLDVLGLCRSCT
jgi:Fe2+ or Zn2+ uptake regulation protein